MYVDSFPEILAQMMLTSAISLLACTMEWIQSMESSLFPASAEKLSTTSVSLIYHVTWSHVIGTKKTVPTERRTRLVSCLFLWVVPAR